MKPSAPKLHLAVNNPTLLVGGDFSTPIWNAGVFHQSTLNDLFVKGLSFTIGLRLDYEKMSMKYTSVSDPTDFNFSMKMMAPPPMPSMSLEAKICSQMLVMTGKYQTIMFSFSPNSHYNMNGEKETMCHATVSKGSSFWRLQRTNVF